MHDCHRSATAANFFVTTTLSPPTPPASPARTLPPRPPLGQVSPPPPTKIYATPPGKTYHYPPPVGKRLPEFSLPPSKNVLPTASSFPHMKGQRLCRPTCRGSENWWQTGSRLKPTGEWATNPVRPVAESELVPWYPSRRVTRRCGVFWPGGACRAGVGRLALLPFCG